MISPYSNRKGTKTIYIHRKGKYKRIFCRLGANQKSRDSWWNSAIEHVLSIFKNLGLISSTVGMEREERAGEGRGKGRRENKEGEERRFKRNTFI